VAEVAATFSVVIPGCAARRRPGIHNPGLWLWIPGSPSGRPGMTESFEYAARETVN